MLAKKDVKKVLDGFVKVQKMYVYVTSFCEDRKYPELSSKIEGWKQFAKSKGWEIEEVPSHPKMSHPESVVDIEGVSVGNVTERVPFAFTPQSGIELLDQTEIIEFLNKNW